MTERKLSPDEEIQLQQHIEDEGLPQQEFQLAEPGITEEQLEEARELAKSLGIKIEEKEEEKETVEITRNEYLEVIDGKIEKWIKADTKAQLDSIRARLKFGHYESAKKRMLVLENRGIKLTFYDDGENVFFDQRETKPVGFKSQRNSWQRIWDEREAKKK